MAAHLADRVILSDDNPRSEDPAQITADILAGTGASAAVEVMHERSGAIAAAIKQAGADDVVLVAGKGHETTQQVGIRKLPFRDQEQVQRYLTQVRS